VATQCKTNAKLDAIALERNAGEVNFSKGLARISLSYFDVGFGNLEVRVSGTKNVVFEPVASKDKPATSPAAKAKTPVIPGLPALPPGVKIPADVEALLQKALEDAGKAVPKKK
jgi:hypothetical protein